MRKRLREIRPEVKIERDTVRRPVHFRKRLKRRLIAKSRISPPRRWRCHDHWVIQLGALVVAIPMIATRKNRPEFPRAGRLLLIFILFFVADTSFSNGGAILNLAILEGNAVSLFARFGKT